MKKTAPIKRLNYSFRSVNEGCRWLGRLDETHRRLNESKRREKGEQADTSGASWSKKILRDWARGFNEARLYRASVSRLRHNPIFLPRSCSSGVRNARRPPLSSTLLPPWSHGGGNYLCKEVKEKVTSGADASTVERTSERRPFEPGLSSLSSWTSKEKRGWEYGLWGLLVISFHVNAGNPGLLGGHSPSFKRISFGNELFQPPPSVVLGFYLFRLHFLFWKGAVDGRLCADFWSFLGCKSLVIHRGNGISTFKKYVLSTKFCLETNCSSNLWNSAFSFLFPCFRLFRGDFCIFVEYHSFLQQRIISTIARVRSSVQGFPSFLFSNKRKIM